VEQTDLGIFFFLLREQLEHRGVRRRQRPSMSVRLIGWRGERLGRFAPFMCLRSVPLLLERVLERVLNRFCNSGLHVGRIEALFLDKCDGNPFVCVGTSESSTSDSSLTRASKTSFLADLPFFGGDCSMACR